MTAFPPAVNQTLPLLDDRFTFQPNPTAPHFLLAAEGSRAVVYQVRDSHGKLHALKVFKPPYRNQHIQESASRLNEVKHLPGMRAAERRLITPTNPVVQTIPDLEWALVMPWIPGITWYDMLVQAETGKAIPLGTAVHVCERFLFVLKELEAVGVTHTDISQANVVLDFETRDVQLIDLEEIYQPGTPPQSRPGSRGYCHPAEESVCCPEGDRYAAAVLAAEMLVLANQELAVHASDSGFFETNAADFRGADRFTRARPWLEQVAPAFSDAFAVAWHSLHLSDCPTLAELHGAVAEAAAKTDIATPAYSCSKARSTSAPSTGAVRTWKPLPGVATSAIKATQEAGSSRPENPGAADKRPFQPPVSKHVTWRSPGSPSSSTSVPVSTKAPQPPASGHDYTVAFWIALLVLVLVLLGVLTGSCS